MYIEKAKNIKNDWWRYFPLGIFVIVFFLFIVGSLPFLIGGFIQGILNVASGVEMSSFEGVEDMPAFFNSNNTALFLLLLVYASGLVGVFFAAKFVHGQSILSLTTSRNKIDYTRILYSFCLITSVILVTFFIDYYLDPNSYELNFNLGKFIVLFIICLTILPLQTSFEEYLCRGYLLQGIGIVTKSRALAFIIPSILFGLLHFANPEIDKLGNIFMIYYLTIGFALGIITLMDEGLELALGWHFANNFSAALLVSADWSVLQTDSIFRYTAEPQISSEIFISSLFFSIIIYHFSVKYKWSGWKEKLFGKVNV